MSLVGRWRIAQMDLWDLEDIDLIEPAFIEFGRDLTGHFRFIGGTFEAATSRFPELAASVFPKSPSLFPSP